MITNKPLEDDSEEMTEQRTAIIEQVRELKEELLVDMVNLHIDHFIEYLNDNGHITDRQKDAIEADDSIYEVAEKIDYGSDVEQTFDYLLEQAEELEDVSKEVNEEQVEAFEELQKVAIYLQNECSADTIDRKVFENFFYKLAHAENILQAPTTLSEIL